MPREWLLRPLLRWISLAAALVAFTVLGERRMHLQNFVLFLVICVGIAAAIVAVFVATARPASDERARGDRGPS